MRIWIFMLPALAIVLPTIWASDKITLQGERTIYTVVCRDGVWQGLHCTGRLSAADRFRFKVLKAQREVVFWTVGTSPLGRLTDCQIVDGWHWTCKASADALRTITLQMSNGKAVHDSTGGTRTFHAIAKWRWFFLRWGAPIGNDADD